MCSQLVEVLRREFSPRDVSPSARLSRKGAAEAFDLAVGSWAKGPGEAHGDAGGGEGVLGRVSSVGDSLVGCHFTHCDAVGGIERCGAVPKGDGGGEELIIMDF